jgi:protein phosphatase
MRKEYSGTYAYKTDIGKVRTNNEDQALVLVNSDSEVFLVVCDGMGGANKGDLASKMAIETLGEFFKNKKRALVKTMDQLWITKAAKEANKKIFDMADQNPIYKGMGTTMVAVLISGQRLMVANIGDSRAYKDNGESLEQITEDQTYVQYLVTTGKITAEQALSHPDRHVLMNALGIYPSVSLAIKFLPYQGEKLLLCTDGLYNQIPLNTLHTIISTDERADQKVNSLIFEANNAGGSDNEGVAYWESLSND